MIGNAKKLILIVLIGLICGCSALGVISSIIPSSKSSSGVNVKTDVNVQKGNNKLNGADTKIKNNLGKVAGNNQDNFQGQNITVNKSNFMQIIISIIVGLLIALLFWVLPHPKVIYKKIKAKITKQ